MYVYKNGKIENAIVVQDRAFHYGDGCFTTAKIIEGRVQLWHRHIHRLENACQQLQLKYDLNLLEKLLKKIYIFRNVAISMKNSTFSELL